MRVALKELVLVSMVLVFAGAPRIEAQEGGKQVSGASVHAFEMKRIDGVPQKLADYKGKVLLIVNVASECGFTPQYEGLQRLHEKYGARGFTVLGFPSNDFGKQEPGSDEEILKFCTDRFKVTFPLFSKVAVLGPDASPLYRFLQEESPNKSAVKWNFHKFLIDPDGKVITAFGAKVTPEDPKVLAAIEDALAKTGAETKPARADAGVRFVIVATDGMTLPDGSKLSLPAEKEKRLAALKAGKPYDAPTGLRWHWNRPSGGAEAAEKTRRAREASPADFPADGALLFYDPEFWGSSRKGFTEADLKAARADVDGRGERTITASIRADRQNEFEAYTGKWVNKPMAVLVDGEIVMNAVIKSPLKDAVVISTGDGFTPAEQKLLIEKLGAGN